MWLTPFQSCTSTVYVPVTVSACNCSVPVIPSRITAPFGSYTRSAATNPSPPVGRDISHTRSPASATNVCRSCRPAAASVRACVGPQPSVVPTVHRFATGVSHSSPN